MIRTSPRSCCATPRASTSPRCGSPGSRTTGSGRPRLRRRRPSGRRWTPSRRPARPARSGCRPHVADARPAWEGVIRADGFAWLWRLIADAGTPGRGSYDAFGWVTPRPGEPVAGDEVRPAMERADAVRSSLLRWIAPFDLLVSPVLPGPAVRHGRRAQPGVGDTYSEIHNLTDGRRSPCAAEPRPKGCRSASSWSRTMA